MLGAGSVKLISDLQSLTLLLLHTQPLFYYEGLG
jgi:hypothetical protein